MILGKRHRKRGYLGECGENAGAKVRRMLAGPPIARFFSPAPHFASRVSEGLELGKTFLDASERTPWAEHPDPLIGIDQLAGAAAILVSINNEDFGGTAARLSELREKLEARPSRPLLIAFDYFVHPMQIIRAAGDGADAIVLLPALAGAALPELCAVAREQGLEPIVEIASAEEAIKAKEAGCTTVAVSARDRDTLKRVDPTPELEESLRPFRTKLGFSLEHQESLEQGKDFGVRAWFHR